jgi:hypothetical protein
MLTKIAIALMLTLSSTPSYAKETKMNPAETQIKQTIETYVKGYLNAEKDLVAKAFNSETRLYSIDEGKIDKTEMNEWLQNLDERKAKGDLRKAELKIKSIDITDTTAIAKIELHFEKRIFTDYLSFLHLNDQWIIVGKIYSVKELK